MNNKLKVALISIICAGLSTPVFALQPQEAEKPADQNVELITGYGNKSVSQLKREITKTTKAFFKDYNKLNDTKQFAVICRKKKKPGSNFKAMACEPRFVKTKRSDMMAMQQAGGTTSSLVVVDFDGASASSGANALTQLSLMTSAARVGATQNKKFNEHVEKLFQENPELLEKYKEIMGLQSEYAYKLANR